MKTCRYIQNKFCRILMFVVLTSITYNSIYSQTAEKKALLVAIGKYPESGGWASINSSNDVKIIKASLLSQGFKEENILTLTEENATKKNILETINTQWYNKLKKSDIAYFQFSGHGQQTADKDGDEIDGYDECIVPFDSPKKYVPGVYEGQNLITDDEIRESFTKIRQKLGPTGHMIVMLDACHSGTGTRGNPLARGTAEVMASETYIQSNGQKVNQKENNKLNKESSVSEKGLAPMVSFFGSAQNQLNYEMTNDQGEHFGSLSYAFSKHLSQLKPNESYRGLFEKIKIEMSNIAPMQQPQAEGDLDMEVMNGKALGNAAFFSVVNISSNKEITINAGYLHGVFEGSKIGFFAPETRDISSVKPMLVGEVIKSSPSTCKIQPQGDFDDSAVKKSWVYVTEKSFGKILVPLQILIKDTALITKLKTKLAQYPFVQLDGPNPKLIISDDPNSKPGSQTLILRTSDDFELANIKIQNDQIDYFTLAKSIKNFAQGIFLRKLELEGVNLNLSFKLMKVVSSSTGTTVEEYIPDETGAIKIHIGETVQVSVKNNGIKAAYFNLIDIQPDNQFKVILPGSSNTPEEMKVLPDQELLIKDQWNIGEPFGAEIFKLVASDKPLDLKNAFGTRGSVNQSPFEKLFSETYGDEFFKTRGSNPVNLSSSDIHIVSTSFIIVK